VRRKQRRPAAGLPADLLADLPNEHDTAEAAIRLESTNATIALIATLPRDQAEAVLLRVVVGLDAEAAARVMGKRPGAVRTAAWRGLRRLATRLDRPAGDAEAQPATRGVTPAGLRTPKGSR
jgi:RNA polymerase sigma-70 factor (ECF subfamily)